MWIDDKDRLAELVMMFHYEQKASGTTHWKLVGVQDAELLRRSGAEVSEGRGVDQRARCTTIVFKGARFRYVSMAAPQSASSPSV